MTRQPNIPPVIETNETEYRDSGIQSTVHVAGHPIHPVLVTFPIGMLVAAFGTDLGYWLTQDPFWARASLWLIGAGLLTAVLAAIVGTLDFLRIERVRARTAGWAHMYLNVAVLVLTVINFVPRLNDPTGSILPWGLVLSTLVALLLGVSGWYGGELVYRHKVSVIGPTDRSRP
ncbi:DUF2231 domain-containing protein [Candidatus Cyanaurora vandensis]|uniref:DUF2231 domain-containing protein n=1 Tax=Candidatus Cyanaurora vandensis TaxID=2714958 RepID=UPI00257E516F|nr:DUF2231 domain-containing protein [Candidatus Cyanaurora vandensis]